MNRTIAAAVIAIVLSAAMSAQAQNTVTFDNQSGEPALVKLIGQTSKEIEVASGTKESVEASAGRYTIKVRYGTPGRYRYTKGEEFEVKETATSRSKITITLHKVVAGNYDSHPISEAEFGTSQAAASKPDQQPQTTPADVTYDATSVSKKLVGIWNAQDGQVLSFDDKSRVSLDAMAIAPGKAAGDKNHEGSLLARPYQLRGKVKFRIIRDQEIERQADKKGPVIQLSYSGGEYQPRWLVVATSDDELSLLDGTQGKVIVFKRLSKEAYKITDETDPGGNAMIWLKVGPGTPFSKDNLMWSPL